MPNNTEHIKAKAVSLAELLQEGRFRVPWHQRYYDWEVSHVETLLRDIEEAAKENRSCHFLGCIMLMSQESDYWEINDGQQRIITFLLICARLCKIYQDAGDGSMGQKILQILFNLDSMHDEKLENAEKLTPRIEPPRNDKTNFFQLIRGESISANGKMTSAWQTIVDFFDSSERQTNEWRKKFTNYLLNEVRIVQLEADKTIDPNAVFEVLNYRGKQLEDVDLIKNHIFSFFNDKSEKRRRETVYENVESVYTAFRGMEAVSTYVRCHLQMEMGFLHGSRNKFYYDVKRCIAGHGNNHRKRDFVYELVGKLARKERMQIFEVLRKPSPGDEYLDQFTKHSRTSNNRRKIQNFLIDLHNYKIAYPVIFALLCRYSEAPDKDRKKRARFAYNGCKCLASFIQRIGHTQGALKPSAYEEPLAQLAQQIAKGRCPTTGQFLDKLRDCDRADVITDSNYIEMMKLVGYKDSTKKARYILGRIVEHTQKDIDINDAQTSVEHILPKGENHYKDGKWPKDFNDDQRIKYTHRLGNLTLLHPRDNKPEDHNNQSFRAKKRIFKNCSYDITNKLCKLDEWTPDEVEKRQTQLARFAAKIWNFRL